MTDSKKHELLSQFNIILSQHMGLHFPNSRLSDLEKGLQRTAEELKFPNVAALISRFTQKAPSKTQIQSLARQLTIGETYFFRDAKIFQLLEDKILPDLIEARRKEGQQLTVWSAGCCTGEEAYSIAITVQKALPEWKDWDIKILATDINQEFLNKAAKGIYTEWSFRATAPGIKKMYFSEVKGGRWEIADSVRQMVRFQYLNLAEDACDTFDWGPAKVDFIFCRNVLMYFAPVKASRALKRFSSALAPGGWLVLGPGELAVTPGKELVESPFAGLRIYQRPVAQQRSKNPIDEVGPQNLSTKAVAGPALDNAVGIQATGLDSPLTPIPAVSEKMSAPATEAIPVGETLIKRGRLLAGNGKLVEALKCCDEAVSCDKLNPVAHYIRGVVLQELGSYKEASLCFKKSIYLDIDFIAAYFAIGILERNLGNTEDATRYLQNALLLARSYPRDSLVEESDGMTASRLVEIIEAVVDQLF